VKMTSAIFFSALFIFLPVFAQEGDLQSKKIEMLIGRFAIEDEDAAADALWKLVEIGEPAVKPLIESLDSKNRRIRGYSIMALGHMKAAPAVEPLMKIMKTEEDVKVCDLAYEALCRIGDVKALEVLIGKKIANSFPLSTTAFKLLPLLGEKAVPELIKAAESGDITKSLLAVDALGKIGDKRATESLIKILKNEKGSMLRASAIESLGLLRNRRAVQPIIETAKAAKPKFSGTIIWDSVNALGLIGGKEAVDFLLDYAKKKGGSIVRSDAVESLGRSGDERVLEPLIALLEDEEYLIRSSAASALGMLGDKKALKPLIKMLLEDKEESVRRGAAIALANFEGEKEIIEPLRKAAEEVDIAASVLAWFNDEKAAELLKKHENYNEEYIYCMSCIRHGDMESLCDLIDFYPDDTMAANLAVFHDDIMKRMPDSFPKFSLNDSYLKQFTNGEAICDWLEKNWDLIFYDPEKRIYWLDKKDK